MLAVENYAICVPIMSVSISYSSLTSGITADFCHLQGQENADISMFTDYSIIGKILYG